MFEEFQVSVEKKLLELETFVIGCNGQTLLQNNVSGNSLAPISVIDLLKDSISFLENELSKKDTIVDYLSNELIPSKRSKSQDSTNSITVDNCANGTINETTNEKEKSAKNPRVIKP